jgi:hypothetical protein
MRGSPSPWKVFAMMPKHASERDTRLIVSVGDRVEDRVEAVIAILSWHRAMLKMVDVVEEAS